MTQAQLDHAVARATGESLSTIRSHGFSPLFIPQVAYGPSAGTNRQEPQANRHVKLRDQPRRQAA